MFDFCLNLFDFRYSYRYSHNSGIVYISTVVVGFRPLSLEFYFVLIIFFLHFLYSLNNFLCKGTPSIHLKNFLSFLFYLPIEPKLMYKKSTKLSTHYLDVFTRKWLYFCIVDFGQRLDNAIRLIIGLI